MSVVARTWLSVRVELVSGRGQYFWPRPGRIFAVARSHTFSQLAEGIDTAFARWDRAHMYAFQFSGGCQVVDVDQWDGEEPEGAQDGRKTKLSRLQPGDQFAYTFDFGDDWEHLCTVGEEKIDPFDRLGGVTDRPLAYWGWGDMPDQYDRRVVDDDGMSPVRAQPKPPLSDLPSVMPHWGR